MTATQLSEFQDPYSFDTKQGLPEEFTDIDSVWGKMSTALGLTDRASYEEYLRNRDREYERSSIQSARAWEEYLDSTKYQRLTKDLKVAGLNPWLAVQNGLSAASHGSSTSTGGSTAKTQKSDDGAKGLAAILVATAKLIAALL